MRKFGKIILSFCFGILLIIGVAFLPTSDVYADAETTQSLSTIYPNGISHYLNLNNVEDFSIVGDNVFFVSKGKKASIGFDYLYDFVIYNTKTNEKNVIIDNNDESNPYRIKSFRNMQYANNMIVLYYDGNLLAYDASSFERLGQINLPSNGELGNNKDFYVVSNFDNSKIAYANIFESADKVYIGVAIYNNNATLLDNPNNMIAYGSFDLSTISIEKAKIKKFVIVNDSAYVVTDEKIYPFNITQNNDSVTLSCREAKSLSILNSMIDVAGFEFDNKNYLAISTNGSISIFDEETSPNTVTKDLGKAIYTSNSVFVQNDKLYFFNSIDSNIQTYSITKQQNKLELSTSTTLLMGKGTETGRFENVNDILMKCNEYIFVSDKANNRIQVLYSDGSVKVINLIDGSTKYYATSLMLSSDNTLYFVRTDSIQTSLCMINIFTDSQPTVNKVCDLPNTICDAIMTNEGLIYLLNHSDNIVKTYNTKTGTFQTDITLSDIYSDINTDAYSKIEYKDNFLYISFGKKLLRVNVKNLNFHNEKEFESDIVDLSIPTSDQSIYVSLENQNRIERCSFETSLDDAKTSVCFDNEYRINVFAVNPQDGTIYAFDENASRIVYFNNKQFALGYSDSESFQDDAISSMFGYTYIVKYAKVPANTFIYEYINYKGNHSLYSEDKYVIILDTIKPTDTFNYVLYTDGDSVKLGYVETDSIEIMAVTGSQNYSLITSSYGTPVYKFPTIKGGYVVDTIENISTVLTATTFYPISIDNTNNTYYVIITSDGRYGFVSSSYVTVNENISQKFSANATIKIYDYSDFVNVYSDKEKSNIIGALSNDQRIYVEKLDKNEDLTFIKYLDGDNNIRSGYIDTKYISTDGTSPVITTAIILFAVNFVIIVALLIWFVIFKKKQKKDALSEQTNLRKTSQKESKNNIDTSDNQNTTTDDNDNKQ